MGKTLVYVLLLAFLGFGVYYFLLRENNGLYSEREANFTIKDTANIGRIFLVRNDGQSVLVERNENNEWLLNKKYEVMPSQLRSFLICLSTQTAHSPVGAVEHDRVIKLLAGLSTKAEIYDRKGNKIRSFFVAGQGSNYHGSYMILENASTPYLVELPGFEGYLTPLYTTEFYDWRSRKIFDISADKIQKIEIEYPEDSLQNFIITNLDHATLSLPKQGKITAPINMSRLKSYLGFYKNINAENYLNGIDAMDSIIANATIRSKIIVTDKNNQSTSLTIYWKDDEDIDLSDQTSTDPKNRPTDVERMYAVNNISHDTLLIQARTFEKLLRKGYEFYDVPDAK